MIRIMFDSNVFDQMHRFADLLSKHIDKYEFLVTTVQIEEIARIPDNKLDKRIGNLIYLARIRAKLVPVSVFSFPMRTSIFSCGNVGTGGKVYRQILNSSKNNINDAKIADTSVHEGCILVTGDKRLLDKMLCNGYRAVYIDDFISSLRL